MSEITITQEDNMIMMGRYPDKYFDLAIVDPPYGIDVAASGKVGGNKEFGSKKSPKNYGAKNSKQRIIPSTNYGAKKWDSESPDKSYFNELVRVSNNQIIWGANHFVSKIPFDSPCWIVWNKKNSGNFADCELAYTSFDTAVRMFEFKWNGMLQEDMSNKEFRIHPTQKPKALYNWLLSKYAKQGDKILDTHLGSGSIAIACIDLGFDLTACEIDPDYFAAAKDRIDIRQRQTALF